MYLIMQDADTSREKYESIINLRTVDKKQLCNLVYINIDFLTFKTKSDTFSVLVIKKLFFTY